MSVNYTASVKCDFCGYTHHIDECTDYGELPSKRIILVRKQREGWKLRAGKLMCPDCIKEGVKWQRE